MFGFVFLHTLTKILTIQVQVKHIENILETERKIIK